LQALSTLFAKVKHATPEWSHERLIPSKKGPSNPLIILVGSQRGLCGNFNVQLAKKLSEYVKKNNLTYYHIAAVGKKSIDYTLSHNPEKLIASYPTLNTRTFSTIAQEISTEITTSEHIYSSVVVISNLFKSFFTQKPTATSLIPLDPNAIAKNTAPPQEGYLWDENPHEVLDALATHYIEAQLQYLLFQSLLSEHAARFVSMDSSTRNANSLLDRTKLEYNKLRQAKITTEITELSGSF
jgi:F-type H+-transporting ATPase subunit gamma